jgi:hypothetical protein
MDSGLSISAQCEILDMIFAVYKYGKHDFIEDEIKITTLDQRKKGLRT